MFGLLRCNITAGVHARGGADVSFRDVTMAQMENEARECGWRHAPEARGGFWEIRKSQFVELRTRLRTGRVDFRGSLRPDEFAHYGRRTRWGADVKARIERMCISLPYVETFNSKVIKGFIPELRSRWVFFVFRDSYVLYIYIYMIWTFYILFAYIICEFVLTSLAVSPVSCSSDLDGFRDGR